MFVSVVKTSFQLFASVCEGHGCIKPRPRASNNEWAILGASSVLYNCSGGLVLCVHIITCFRSVIVHYCRRCHHEVIVYV